VDPTPAQLNLQADLVAQSLKLLLKARRDEKAIEADYQQQRQAFHNHYQRYPADD